MEEPGLESKDTVDTTQESAVLNSLIESGTNEINRETNGLLLSAFSAGLDIGFGPFLMAVVLTLSPGGYGDLGTELLLASVYSVGFVLVIVGQAELFTEHTAEAMMPVLDGRASLAELGRLWGLVYVSNIVGGAVFVGLIVTLLPDVGVASPEAFEAIALSLVNQGFTGLFVGGVLAGWLMGCLAWMVTAARETTSRLIIIWIVTATIGLLHLPHSIAGNVEVLFGVFLSPQISVIDYVSFLVLATFGNAVGGVVFVALLKYGHVVRGGE